MHRAILSHVGDQWPTFERGGRAGCTLTVTSGADGGTGTLRQAILNASVGDTINFAAGITTINLTSGELLIDRNLTINGLARIC